MREWRGRDDGVLRVFARGDRVEAGALGGGERVLPAGVRGVPAVFAVGGEGVPGQRGQL